MAKEERYGNEVGGEAVTKDCIGGDDFGLRRAWFGANDGDGDKQQNGQEVATLDTINVWQAYGAPLDVDAGENK